VPKRRASRLDFGIERADVAARAEGAIAGAAEHDGRNAAVVLPRGEELRELLEHAERERIQDGRTVQRDCGSAGADFNVELPQSFFHAGLRFSRNAFTPSAWSAWSKRSMKSFRSRARAAVRGGALT